MKRALVPAIPAALSLLLSLATVGREAYWQDSAVYLTAVQEMSVLYPPGFVVYQVLCKAWTLLLGFLDFTLAVHLFSSLFAALAAATLALAARDFLRARGPVFKTLVEDPGEAADWIGLTVGCLAATGYTFWFSGIYAKGYSLYYFVLALLLWRMIRADGSGKPRDFTVAAALMGLAWQIHPSAALAGAGLLLFVASRARALGAKGIAWRAGLAAACALGPSLLLLALARRDTVTAFSEPTGLGDLWVYLRGERFTRGPGEFGWAPSRVLSVGVCFLQEHLLVASALMAAGLAALAKANPRLLLGMAAWIVPYLAVTVLFKREGQQDHWFIGAWMPLWLAAGLGLHAAAKAAARRGRQAIALLGAAGAVSAIAVNGPLLNLRNADLPIVFGKIHLELLDDRAVVVTRTSESTCLAWYLQIVRSRRTDVTVVWSSQLSTPGLSGPGWYDRRLAARHPGLRTPDYGAMRRRFPRAEATTLATAAWLNENAGGDRPLFVEMPPPAELLRPDLALQPAGVYYKLVPRGRETTDPRHWDFTIRPADVRARYGRARGQDVRFRGSTIEVRPEPYERRLLVALLRARQGLADWHAAREDAQGYLTAADLYQEILDADPETAELGEVVYPLARCRYGLKDFARAEPLLRRAVTLALEPFDRAEAHFYLGEIHRLRKENEEARGQYFQAGILPGLPEAFRAEVERRRKEVP